MCDRNEIKQKQAEVIPLLQKEMERAGYISGESIKRIAEATELSEAEIYGVVTFYAQFRLKPKAKHSISICTGTACFVLGAKVICDTLEKRLGIGDGQVSEDGLFELHYVRCLGCCGLAPVVSVDGKIYSNMTPLSINKLVDGLYEEAKDENC